MTATINESATAAPAAGGVGRVSRVIGPVVDVEFSADTMPEVYNLLTLEVSLNGEKKNINLEVAQHIGDSMVRAISLQPTDGIVRGSEVRDSGGPISVPVGDAFLGAYLPIVERRRDPVLGPRAVSPEVHQVDGEAYPGHVVVVELHGTIIPPAR